MIPQKAFINVLLMTLVVYPILCIVGVLAWHWPADTIWYLLPIMVGLVLAGFVGERFGLIRRF